MYTDYILYGISVLFAILAVVLVFYLSASKNRTKLYEQLLQQEDTEELEELTKTLSKTLAEKTVPSQNHRTETLFLSRDDDTQTLMKTSLDETELLNGPSREERHTSIATPPSLEGRYVIEQELFGGGMSRIFLARSTKIGNQWIVKYIDNRNGALTNEENILKLLNHINLPKIIDIFKADEGVYLVESFVEGVSLDKIIKSGQKIGQYTIVDWAEQMVQVLNYLHTLEPSPIIHCDLKPSNIMVTHDNKLVLIDFGISKRYGDDADSMSAVTYNYAAPEQLKHRINEKHMKVIESRFGRLPESRIDWNADQRTDIYSLGVILFELATGHIPAKDFKGMLDGKLSKELAEIIYKCLEVDPSLRYQNTNELLKNLQWIKSSKVKMARSLTMRKVAMGAIMISVLVSGCSFAGGRYITHRENLSLLTIIPNAVTISKQQTAEIEIQKILPDGEIETLDTSQIRWSKGNGDIVHIDGNRIAGMNIGKDEIVGKYRDKVVVMNVNVVQPMDGMVDISLHYRKGLNVKEYAGAREREHIDGTLKEASFVSPESITRTDDGSIYITDAGRLRKISGGKVDSIFFQPDYLTSRVVRSYKNEVYILTDAWEEPGGKYYGFIRLGADGVEGLYIADAIYTSIEDFDFTPDGEMYFIERNEGVQTTYLKALTGKNNETETICELVEGAKGLTIDNESNIYVANSEKGIIQKYNPKSKELTCFAGVENKRHFIDGALPLFYQPLKIHYADGALYVLDFNVLRKIVIKDGSVLYAETVAGEVSTENIASVSAGSSESVTFPRSLTSDFLIDKNGGLITNPKQSNILNI